MAKRRIIHEKSDKYCYKSRYSDGFITPAEYITHMLVAREIEHYGNKAEKYFWDNPFWCKKLTSFRMRVNQLLKLFSPEDVINTFNRPDMKKCWSPSQSNLHQKIREEQHKEKAREEMKPPEPVVIEETKTRKQFGKPNAFSKLREIENGEEERRDGNDDSGF